MKIDREEVRRIAALASLEFDESAADRVAGELSAILDYVDQLREVDVSGVSDSVAEDLGTPRQDTASVSLPLDPIEKNAPSMLHAHFVVPKVIGGE